jgi:hypothetical protein
MGYIRPTYFGQYARVKLKAAGALSAPNTTQFRDHPDDLAACLDVFME